VGYRTLGPAWTRRFPCAIDAGKPETTPGATIGGEREKHLNADDQVQAAGPFYAAPAFMAGRPFIGSRKPVPPAKLGDASVSMKEVAA
jgi:hypothetical protein